MADIIVVPDSARSRGTTFELEPFLGRGIDPITRGLQLVAAQALRDKVYSPSSVSGLVRTFQGQIFPWLVEAAASLGRPLTFNDIDPDLALRLAADLRQRLNYTTAAKVFQRFLLFLKFASQIGLSKPLAEIRPPNPFPKTKAAQRATLPYSRRERSELLGCLAKDLQSIRAGTSVLAPLEELVVYFLLIAFRSGFNATPLLELSRDAIRPHPLRKDYWLLVGYKLRALRTVKASAKWSELVAQFATVPTDLVTLYREVLAKTAPAVDLVDVQHKHYAFLRPPLGSRASARAGQSVPLTNADVSTCIHQRLAARYAITGDDGKPLRINLRRIRATLASRAYELSGGDPFVVAKLLNNSPLTAAIHYLSAPPDAATEFAAALHTYENRLRNGTPASAEKTPLGKCSDTKKGRYAPNDGVTHCQRWLHCFKCPNHCVSGDDDDLWRLYSFYWLLQRNAEKLRHMPISGMTRFAIRVMDEVIPSIFGPKAISARDRARHNPHPFWVRMRDDDLLLSETYDAR